MKNHKFRPKKGLGQNFLLNQGVLRKIIEAAELQTKDTVLEIGPGIGNLTQELAKKAKKVVAVEKDPKLCEILKENIKILGYRNIKVIQGDILKIFNLSAFGRTKSASGETKSAFGGEIFGRAEHFQFLIFNYKYKLVANLPYYIVSPVIRKFLESENPPTLMVLMVQKEVAQRIVSRVPDMNLLAVSVQFYAEPKIISYVSKKSFWPQPKVDSAIIKIIPRINTDKERIGREAFFRILRAGFSQPRKQILNNFSKELKLNKEAVKEWLLKNNISPSQRAETLTLANWKRLTETFEGL